MKDDNGDNSYVAPTIVPRRGWNSMHYQNYSLLEKINQNYWDGELDE